MKPEAGSNAYCSESAHSGCGGIYLKEVVGTLVLITVTILFSALGGGLNPVRALDLQPHQAIHILGDGDFSAANGVTGGSGMASDPYIIEGWDITHSPDSYQWPPILIADTDSYFVVRNIAAEAVHLWKVTNGRVESSSMWGGASVDDCSLVVSGTNIALVANQVSNGIGGICVGGSDIAISDNTIFDNGESGGILTESPLDKNITISDNIIVGNFRGIRIEGGSNITLLRNVVSNGVIVGAATNVVFRQNTMSGIVPIDVSLYGGGDSYYASSLRSFDITPDNLVNSRPLYFFKDCEDLNINGIDVGQLIVVNCNRVRVEDIELPPGPGGVQIFYAENVTISRSRLSIGSYQPSIIVMLCGAVTLSDNQITLYGARILLGCGSSTIFGNTIISNPYTGAELVLLGAAKVYHNNFTNVLFWPTFADGSLFDNAYPSGGNFWSDYSGVDNCSGSEQNICPDPDGIGDTPYTTVIGTTGNGIDIILRDRYPLMRPFAPFVDGSVDLKRALLSTRDTRGYFSAYIELPQGFNPSAIILSSIRLNDAVGLAPGAPVTRGDVNHNGVPDIAVRFNTEDVRSLLTGPGIYVLWVSGNILDRSNFRPFVASTTIRVL